MNITDLKLNALAARLEALESVLVDREVISQSELEDCFVMPCEECDLCEDTVAPETPPETPVQEPVEFTPIGHTITGFYEGCGRVCIKIEDGTWIEFEPNRENPVPPPYPQMMRAQCTDPSCEVCNQQ